MERNKLFKFTVDEMKLFAEDKELWADVTIRGLKNSNIDPMVWGKMLIEMGTSVASKASIPVKQMH